MRANWVEELRSISDTHARVRAMFAGLRPVFERTAGIERVLQQAAGADAEIAELAADVVRRQRQDAAVFRSLFVGDDPIFQGLSAAQDRDALWALTGIGAYRRLVDDCGWAPEEWERWVVELVMRLLAR